MIHHAGLEEEVEKLNTMPLHLGASVLSNSKRILNTSYTQLIDFIQMMFITQILIHYTSKINISII